MGVTMSKDKKSQAQATEPIKFETVYPIHIRTKDGALAFAPPGEPIKFETNDNINIALLAHKMNEIIIQMHRMQRVVFANNKIISNNLVQKKEDEDVTQNDTSAETTKKQ